MAEKLVKVYTSMGEAEALVIKALLESQRIPSILRSNSAPSVHVFFVDGLGEYHVMVNESDAEVAKSLIRENKSV